MLVSQTGGPATHFSNLNTSKADVLGKRVTMSEAQYAELFDLFSDAGLPDHCMSMEGADGYLTACLVGPSRVLPNAYLAAIFGQDELPICADSATQARIVALLLLRASDIVHTSSMPIEEIAQSGHYWPLLAEVPEGECITPHQLREGQDDGTQAQRIGNWFGKDWGQGFMYAARQDPAWKPIFDDPKAAELLGAITVLAAGYNPDQPELQIDMEADMIGPVAVDVWKLRSYWDDIVFGGGPAFRRDGPKIGRNDPCSCGSGKKFKKCCGV